MSASKAKPRGPHHAERGPLPKDGEAKSVADAVLFGLFTLAIAGHVGRFASPGTALERKVTHVCEQDRARFGGALCGTSGVSGIDAKWWPVGHVFVDILAARTNPSLVTCDACRKLMGEAEARQLGSFLAAHRS